jgi:uncharacterized UPF0160 family protein
MQGTEETPAEIVNDAIQEASDRGFNEGVVIADAFIENAQERIENAEQAAEQIAAAAMEGERGRRIAALEMEVSEWRAHVEQLSQQLQTLQEQVTNLSTSQAAIVGMEIQEALSSTPQPLAPITETLEEAAEIAEVLPEALSQSDVAESPAPLIARKVRRLI